MGSWKISYMYRVVGTDQEIWVSGEIGNCGPEGAFVGVAQGIGVKTEG